MNRRPKHRFGKFALRPRDRVRGFERWLVEPEESAGERRDRMANVECRKKRLK